MTYKTIFLPDWIMTILYVLSIILSLFISTIALLLYPFKWLKFKFHIVVFALCMILGCYWCFTNKEKAFLYAICIFFIITFLIAIINLIRLALNKISIKLSKFYTKYPLVKFWITIPVFVKKQDTQAIKTICEGDSDKNS